MLNSCTSLIVAGRRSDLVELVEFSRQVGFGAIVAPDAEQTPPITEPKVGPITYFVIDSRTPLEHLRGVVKALRRSSDPNLRFAPVVVVGSALTQLQTRHFAMEGFDDIISLPMDTEQAITRLEEQLVRTNYYYETADYLGPDRRRYSQREPGGSGSYVLYHVWRDPKSGVRTRAARIAGKPRIAPALPKLLRP